jgi:hypothetical protein
METHSVLMIATMSRTATVPYLAGLLREGAGWAIAASQSVMGLAERDARGGLPRPGRRAQRIALSDCFHMVPHREPGDRRFRCIGGTHDWFGGSHGQPPQGGLDASIARPRRWQGLFRRDTGPASPLGLR